VTNIGPTSHTYISQRLRLHYVDWGNPGAPPLLLLHGGQDHCRSWDWVAQALRADFHIIAPDLRGHGDSQWPSDGNYRVSAFIYDLAQLIHQQDLAPLSILAHSLGGNIAVRYTGIYPETVRRLVAIEGLGLPPKVATIRDVKAIEHRMSDWIGEQRRLSTRQPRRYASIEQALTRMREENGFLSPDQALHLTQHGVSQNEDGSYSWKFDNYIRSIPPTDLTGAEVQRLWGKISCPTLLVYGQESWDSNPALDGRLQYFANARVSLYERAGHWVHHDRLEAFVEEAADFLRAD
jgi:pimeloyl-ACP methyl ester carboxylesterase